MKKVLFKAIHEELTEKQKIITLMYHQEGKKVTEIAENLGLNKSTVSRHLKYAEKKLKKIKKFFLEVA